MARRAGAEESARPVGLPGDRRRDEARAHRRDRDVPRWQRALPRVAVRPRGARRGHVDRHRARARRTIRRIPGSRTSEVAHPPIRPSSTRCVLVQGQADPRHPRLRSLAGARRGRARDVRAARSGRLLPDRGGLEHRADPQGPDARPVRGGRDVSRGTDEFVIDREREKFLITFNPSGYLRRVR